MSDFKIAVARTLKHEGGFTNNPSDSGGATNMGITQRDLPNIPIETLTVDQAVAYYQENYWKALYSQITSQEVANLIFDSGVLFGVGTAVRILQGIFSAHGAVTDGLFGPHTLDLTNTAEPVGLLAAYKTALVSHALAVVQANPKDRQFFAGWVRRINS
jgi:lysozyme family protein